jgi:hypothetical protein
MARVNWRTVRSPLLTPEQVAVKLYDAAKGKAAARKLEFNLHFNTVLGGVKAGQCAMSGILFDMRQKPYGMDFPFRASLDRIDNTLGYLDSNVQIVCKIYNSAKYVWNDEDVIRLAIALTRRSHEHKAGL